MWLDWAHLDKTGCIFYCSILISCGITLFWYSVMSSLVKMLETGRCSSAYRFPLLQDSSSKQGNSVNPFANVLPFAFTYYLYTLHQDSRSCSALRHVFGIQCRIIVFSIYNTHTCFVCSSHNFSGIFHCNKFSCFWYYDNDETLLSWILRKKGSLPLNLVLGQLTAIVFSRTKQSFWMLYHCM